MIQTETTISVNGIEKPYAGLKVLEKIDFTVERGARGIEGRADERHNKLMGYYHCVPLGTRPLLPIGTGSSGGIDFTVL